MLGIILLDAVDDCAFWFVSCTSCEAQLLTAVSWETYLGITTEEVDHRCILETFGCLCWVSWASQWAAQPTGPAVLLPISILSLRYCPPCQRSPILMHLWSDSVCAQLFKPLKDSCSCHLMTLYMLSLIHRPILQNRLTLRGLLRRQTYCWTPYGHPRSNFKLPSRLASVHLSDLSLRSLVRTLPWWFKSKFWKWFWLSCSAFHWKLLVTNSAVWGKLIYFII